jgi:IS30 family transposase
MTIASMKQTGSSVRATARALGRSASTVSRELTRNTCADAAYASSAAQSRSHDRRRHARPVAKLHPRSGLWLIVLSMLNWNWSPQQISGILKRVYPTDASKHVSHETIYTAIYAHPRGELRRQLIACLRQGRSTRLPRTRGIDRRGRIPDMLSIHVRPPEIEDRVMPGHWEGDFIKGAGNQSSVGVLVERSSRLVLLARMEDATAASALLGFAAKLNLIAAPLRLCLTYDQARRWPSTPNSQHKRASRSISVIPTAHGNGAVARTPMGCCASTCQREPIYRFTPKKTSMPLPISSTNDPARPMIFTPRWRSLGECSRPLLNRQFNSIEPGVALGT